MKKLWDFGWGMYRKHEEGINYLIFGFLAFVLNYVLYFIFADAIAMHYMAATVLSWVLTVVFAYWTNRTFVFKSQNRDASAVWKEFISFIGARVATEVLEIVLMYVMVDIGRHCRCRYRYIRASSRRSSRMTRSRFRRPRP